MDSMNRIEHALKRAVERGCSTDCPPRLAAAIDHAVFPRASRLRPRLCLAVAAACGDDRPELTDAAATAIELLHCASLVHDDLPCFDDAATRRGKPSVHNAFGEPLAVLTGDALIVMAFESIAQAARAAPSRAAAVLGTVIASVGAPAGIVAGQAWECEPNAALETYQRAKTGALFAGATSAGAAAAGAAPAPWRLLGERIGEAYQVVDDVRDVACRPQEVGKPVCRDAALGRPNAALQLGLPKALAHLEGLLDEAAEAVPACPGREALRTMIRIEAQRFLPREALSRAA